MPLYVDVSHVSVYQCNVMQRILTTSYVIMYACLNSTLRYGGQPGKKRILTIPEYYNSLIGRLQFL